MIRSTITWATETCIITEIKTSTLYRSDMIKEFKMGILELQPQGFT